MVPFGFQAALLTLPWVITLDILASMHQVTGMLRVSRLHRIFPIVSYYQNRSCSLKKGGLQ